MTGAVSRLAQEAKQALSFGGRGVRDITQDFTAASDQLQPGELVKHDFFTLFESVGAIEIMDPKMDSGYVAPNDTFDADFDPASGLEATEILWIIDQLLCLEITWYDGYPLSQTIFTSLHIDRLLAPDRQRRDPSFYHQGEQPTNLTQVQALGHEILRAYCVGLVKCCDLALRLIQSQNFYEEEDFVTHLFGRDLFPQMSTTEADEIMQEARTQLRETDLLPRDVREALEAHLRFRSGYLRTLAEEGEFWGEMIEILKTIGGFHGLATPFPAAFSEKVQRQLATSTPPRPMLQVSWDNACRKWTDLCQDVIAAHRLTQRNIVPSPACLQRAVWAFAYRGEPCTLARAAFQDIIFANGAVRGEIPHYDLLLADIRDLVLSGDPLADPMSFQVEVTSDPRHICSRIIEGFMDKAVDEYLNLYRMVCQNRCRIRRTFTQAIPILDTMESEAMKTDLKLSQVTTPAKLKDQESGRMVSLDPFKSWSKFYKLHIMAWSVQLGFETDIYLPDELGNMYWFLSRLCSQRSNLLKHIERFTTERMRNARGKRASVECLSTIEYLNSQHSVSETTRLVAEALWKLYTLLISTAILQPPKRDFAASQLLYEARMKPFLAVVNDPIPSHSDFETAAKQTADLATTCKDVDEKIKAAKALLADLKKSVSSEQGRFVGTEEEWKREVKLLETTCVAVSVAASQLLRISEKVGRREGLGEVVECEVVKKYHVWWVVPLLKEK